MKVLIADPDWRFAQKASIYLESRADLVVHVSTADEALTSISQWQPDVVMLAAELAEGDMLQTIMQQEDRPAILLTDQMDRFDRAWRAWQNGGDEILLKPVFAANELQLAIITARENALTGERPMAPMAVPA